MNNVWRFLPWLHRFILLAPLALITLLATRAIFDPVHMALEHGWTMDSEVGVTNYRSGNGGLLLVCAIIIAWSLLATRRHVLGLFFIAVLMGVILAVRLVSVIIDSTVIPQLRLLIAEALFLLLSVAGIVLERARR
jgi:hypothetical protein